MTTVREYHFTLALDRTAVEGAKAVARAKLAIATGDLRAAPIAMWEHEPAVTAGRELAAAGFDITFPDDVLSMIQRFPKATFVMASTLVDVAEEVFPPDLEVVNNARMRHLFVVDTDLLPFRWQRGRSGRSGLTADALIDETDEVMDA